MSTCSFFSGEQCATPKANCSVCSSRRPYTRIRHAAEQPQRQRQTVEHAWTGATTFLLALLAKPGTWPLVCYLAHTITQSFLSLFFGRARSNGAHELVTCAAAKMAVVNTSDHEDGDSSSSVMEGAGVAILLPCVGEESCPWSSPSVTIGGQAVPPRSLWRTHPPS